MTVFHMLAGTGEGPQEAELRHHVEQLRHLFPDATPTAFLGDSGTELTVVSAQLSHINHLNDAVAAAQDELPALRTDVALEARQRRGKMLLLALAVMLVTLVIVGVLAL